MSMLHFKFQKVNENGHAAGWFAQKGELSNGRLILQDESYDAAEILSTAIYEQAFAFTVLDGDATRTITINVKSGNARDIKQQVDVLRSARYVDSQATLLQSQGSTNQFRKEVCPVCGASLNLTHFEQTPQIFCDYCETISTVPTQPETPDLEKEYRLCECCGMYSRPQRFTEFYFYFLFFIYGFWTNQSWRCPACMRGTAWRMLAANALFVVGIIPSVWQLVRAYASDKVAGPFSGLHAANLNASRRKYSKAIKTYQSICDRVPAAAGVHYNLGHALVKNDEWERAAAAFELALDDCSNYRFAAGGLMHCYETLGRKMELADLKSQWGFIDPPAIETEQTERKDANV